MGYLLKEALKTLCGVNRWSYAVFWKIGCQNPRLLIWEDCYHEPLTCSALPEYLSCNPTTQAEDKLLSLINRMMKNNQICVVGEGIIGRAAFTGNHQWFVSSSYSKVIHPPEVSNEMQHQFSAGIQTVAVIPVSPHGVVQLGSSYCIMENLGIANDIKSLILQLGCIPGALFSTDSTNARVSGYLGTGLSDPVNVDKITSSNNLMVGSGKELSKSSNCSRLISGQSQSLACKVQEHPSTINSAIGYSFQSLEKAGFCSRSQVGRGVARAQVISSNPDQPLNQFFAPRNAHSGVNFQEAQQHMGVQHFNKPIQRKMHLELGCLSQSIVNSETVDSHSISQLRMHSNSLLDSNNASQIREGGELLNERKNYSSNATGPSISNPTEVESLTDDLTELEGIPLFNLSDQLMAYATEVLSGGSELINHPLGMNHTQVDPACKNQRVSRDDSTLASNLPSAHLDEHKPLNYCGRHGAMSPDPKYEGRLQHLVGDDLFDIFGSEMKNYIFSGLFDSDDPHNLRTESLVPENIQGGCQYLYLADKDMSEFGFSTGNDHLLDAVVSSVHSASKQSPDNSLSCKSTLTRISNSSNTIGKLEEGSFGISRPPAKEGTVGSCYLNPSCTKPSEASSSQSDSHCSQTRSWVDQAHAMRRDNSNLTAYPKGADGVVKPNRKRLKPGENPKPRPKDRQMIQDRLKELRDIVPNGAKCSIDALLERTVKHMMFLQSVSKHDDKLKHIGESRIVDKEGRMFLKDNFDGGATWAFEIGSTSEVCPVIVEDLNPPRQLLVEMLCKEDGYFLEIADMVCRLGLTILTGVIESRNENVWARFAVEADRDVTRMEIFMLLVQALEQQAMKGGGPVIPETAVRDLTLVRPHRSFSVQ